MGAPYHTCPRCLRPVFVDNNPKPTPCPHCGRGKRGRKIKTKVSRSAEVKRAADS